jgi:hypothetical protein
MTRHEADLTVTQKTSREVASALASYLGKYRGADNSLSPPGREQATATEDVEFHISYLLS